MTNYNFRDLTPESKRMIFAQAIGFAVGAKWVNIATNLSSMAAQYAVAKGALEQSSFVSDEQIEEYFRAIDNGEITFFSSDSIDKLKSLVPDANKATVSFTEDEVEDFFSNVINDLEMNAPLPETTELDEAYWNNEDYEDIDDE